MAPPTVLVLDAGLGFAFALSLEMSTRHITALAARTALEARTMITHSQAEPHVVVINCKRPGACSFAEAVAKEYRDVKVVGIVSGRYQCRKCRGRLAATFRDPDDTAPERIAHCADVIQRLLTKE